MKSVNTETSGEVLAPTIAQRIVQFDCNHTNRDTQMNLPRNGRIWPQGPESNHLTSRAQNCLSRDIVSTIDRYRLEFDMTYGDVVGVLEVIKWSILKEVFEHDEDEEDGWKSE